MDVREVAELVGTAVDAAGVAVIALGVVVATAAFLVHRRRTTSDEAFRRYRRDIGRGILLGLEILVAGDIIRTVAIEPTFRSVGVLAAIVAIRTFLSWTLEVELTGRWPWRSHRPATAADGS